MVNIQGLSRAAVLAALYNASKPQGMGMFQYDPTPMSVEQAQALLDRQQYFDYLKGRVMKINLLSEESFDERCYDRDNGPGAAQRAVDLLRKTGDENNPAISAAHERGVLSEADRIKGHLKEKTEFHKEDDHATVTLGLGDVADKLGPAVDKAVSQQPTKAN